MRPYEKQLLEKRLKDFMDEVIPYDLFPFLPCLTQQDREEIEATQTQHGPIRATMVLVDRLKRRDKGFQDFVLALRQCGGEHTALVLDPFYTVKGKFAGIFIPSGDGSLLVRTYDLIRQWERKCSRSPRRKEEYKLARENVYYLKTDRCIHFKCRHHHQFT